MEPSYIAILLAFAAGILAGAFYAQRKLVPKLKDMGSQVNQLLAVLAVIKGNEWSETVDLRSMIDQIEDRDQHIGCHKNPVAGKVVINFNSVPNGKRS